MRVNEPITNDEVELPEEPLVSRTDLQGRITFANHVFVEVSGFSEQELIGAPHNIVRHPHMPKEAFANLWATIKAGRPWDGLVKNRSRNGGFYWVRANVTPIIENGQVAGFISIRSKPDAAAVAAAEKTYTAIRNGTAHGIGLRDGEIVTTGCEAGCWTHGDRSRGRLAFAVAAVIHRHRPPSDGSDFPAWPPRTACCGRSMRTTWCRSTSCAASWTGCATAGTTSPS